MSFEFLILAGIIVVVGIVLYLKKHPDAAAEIHSRLDETEARVRGMIDNRKPSSPTPTQAPAVQNVPAEVDHVGIVTAAMQGAAAVVSSLPAPTMSTAGGIPIGVGSGGSAPPEVGEVGPPAVRGDQNGLDLWNESFWRCNLNPGQSASRQFAVPAGYQGVIEYFADNAAMQGDFIVTLDGTQLVGAGQEITSLCPPGTHTLAAQCVNPLSVGRTWATSAMSIRHTP